MKASGRAPVTYPIRAVSKLTGISIDTLRAWERRYNVVTPSRDDRGRVYSEADVARLRLVHRAVSAGHGIGRVAPLGDGQLRRLVAPAPAAADEKPTVDTTALTTALLTLDSIAVDREATRLAALLSPVALVRDALLPVLREVGDHWNARRGGVSREHVMSAALRHLFGSYVRFHGKPNSSVRIAFTTLPGDQHEIGILAAAMLAAAHGCGVSYVGPNLPARDIVDAIAAAKAHVLVLGVTFASNAGARQRDLRAIVRALPADVELWIGGRDASACASLVEPRGTWIRDFDGYQLQLERVAGHLPS